MKIALHSPAWEDLCAETELILRISKAAGNLGWDCLAAGSSEQINAFRPDFVLSLHFVAPKLWPFPTYGCMWNPPTFFQHIPFCVKHLHTLDAYLVSSEPIEHWVRNSLFGTPKTVITAPFFTSCHDTPYEEANFENPRLFYSGFNWDGDRHGEVFKILDGFANFDVYGPAGKWKHAPGSYRGTLPFDGVSVINALRAAGIGLCLHKQDHVDARVPSMRIFEIAAAGAVAVCGEHPFIRRVFGDNVLYVDTSQSAEEIARQIKQCVYFVVTNRQQAKAMARRCHEIFSSAYSLEKLLTGVAAMHERVLRERYGPMAPPSAGPRVQVILRAAGEREALRRTLRSLAAQTLVPGVSLIGQADPAGEPAAEFASTLHISHVAPESAGSAPLWSALRQATAEYVALIDEGTEWFTNHLSTLVNALDSSPGHPAAYSGVVQTKSLDAAQDPVAHEPASIAHFDAYDQDRLLRFDRYIHPNAFLARRGVLTGKALDDPGLGDGADLALQLMLAARGPLLATHEVTARIYQYLAAPTKLPDAEVQRLKVLFSHVAFPAYRPVAGVDAPPVLETRQPQDVIEGLKALWTQEADAFTAGAVPLVLRRPAKSDEGERLVKELDAGTPRSRLVRNLVLSEEAAREKIDIAWLPRMAELDDHFFEDALEEAAHLPDEAFVRTLYQLLLGRQPDGPGLVGHVLQLSRGLGRGEMLESLVTSPEAAARGLRTDWFLRLRARGNGYGPVSVWRKGWRRVRRRV